MAIHRLCSISNCDKPIKARGWCSVHYSRWRDHGDPLTAPSRAANGAGLQWLRAHMSHDGQGCLSWPFARDQNGYGKLSYQGRVSPASRVMCTLVHGDPPRPNYEAAHSCGKGHEGCVNPQHLRWATRYENHMDMDAHGTMQRGEQQAMSKLSQDDVQSIRALHGRMSQSQIAQMFGTTKANVHHIHHRNSWAWLD